ncbi:MAG: hypothetical protein R2939_21960 [Kofleriaceae bacterium]
MRLRVEESPDLAAQLGVPVPPRAPADARACVDWDALLARVGGGARPRSDTTTIVPGGAARLATVVVEGDEVVLEVLVLADAEAAQRALVAEAQRTTMSRSPFVVGPALGDVCVRLPPEFPRGHVLWTLGAMLVSVQGGADLDAIVGAITAELDAGWVPGTQAAAHAPVIVDVGVRTDLGGASKTVTWRVEPAAPGLSIVSGAWVAEPDRHRARVLDASPTSMTLEVAAGAPVTVELFAVHPRYVVVRRAALAVARG